MKKSLAMLLAGAMVIASLTACGGSAKKETTAETKAETTTETTAETKKLQQMMEKLTKWVFCS